MMTRLGRRLLFPLLALACAREGDGPLARCQAAQGDEATLAVCGEAFGATGAPRAAAAAAWAAQALGRNEEALTWIARVPSAERPAGLESLAASLHLAQGDAAAARAAYRADLPRLAAAGDRAGEARARYGLGYLAWRDTEYGPALAEFEAGIEAAGAAGDGDLLGLNLQGLQGVLSAVGDLDGAERVLDRVASLVAPEDRRRQAMVLAQRGNLLLDRELPALARPVLEEALRLIGEGPPAEIEPRLARTIHLNLVKVALDRGETEPAAFHLEAAEGLVEGSEHPFSVAFYRARVLAAQGRNDVAAQQLRALLSDELDADWRWLVEDQLGRQLEVLGDREGARQAYGRAIEVLDELRRGLASDDLKAWLLESKRHPFEALFRLEAEDGRPLAALGVVERAKARSFLDAFVRTTRTVPDGPLSQAALRFVTLERLLPRLAASPVVQPRLDREWRAAVGSRHVLEFFSAEKELWRIVIAAGQVRVEKVGPVSAIERWVAAAVAEPDAPRGEHSAWNELGRVLLPEAALPERGSPLWIVADGALVDLPFAALPVGNEPLVARHRLAMVPSLTALAALAAAPDEPAGAAGRRVLGDPRGDLPQAAEEAREVASRLGVRALLGLEARRDALALGASDLLHVAAHTGTGAEGPWLELADGRLTASDVLALPLAPRLAVLATCAAAEGPSRDLWGSLGAAFLAAGSRNVLASLWSLDDAEARRLVSDFYAFGGAQRPSEALASLQRAALAEGRPLSSWASLIVFGGVGESGPAAFPDSNQGGSP